MRCLVNYEGCWGSLKRRKWNQWLQKLRTSDKVQWSAFPCKYEAKWRAKKIKSSLTIFRVSYPQNKTKSLESEGQKNSPQVLYNPGNDNHTVRCLFWGKFDSEKKNGGKLIISYVMFKSIVGMQRFSSRASAAHKKWKKCCLQMLLQFRQILDGKRHEWLPITDFT